ncbi:U4/U6.U5 tri-snRNP-associated protein 1 [Lepeophtheirus salmonis]|uniref:U4/U6.U5 tri-snRNP-associated protein 1 n=1 Tax=Lepeophtheirus salmonis TaxID=72036 RepID=UPI001AE11EEF|nr:U4/U6.U5 tri-snRNP-associated protein 1-like [Lepeophtheirus salmonis]
MKMSSYTEKVVRMRRREDDKEVMIEDTEEGEYSSRGEGSEEESEERRSHHHRKKSSKKHHKKHHKKEKKKKKRRKRSSSRNPSLSPAKKISRKSSPDDTDHEGGDRASTPEIIDVDAIEDGEISSPESKMEVIPATAQNSSRSPPSILPPANNNSKSSHSKSLKRRRSPSFVEEQTTKGRSKKENKSSNGENRHDKHLKSPEKRSKSPSKEDKDSFKESLSIEETNKLREKVGLKPLKVDAKSESKSSSKDKQPSPTQAQKNESKDSLSVEETNRLRAEIGLKPLKVNNVENGATSAKTDSHSEFSEFEVIPSSLKNERHRPPQNLAEISRTEKMRKKIQERREKRRQESKLLLVRGLGDSDDEEDNYTSWVKKQGRLQKEKEAAAKRAKMLDELDDDFGVGDIIKEEFPKTRKINYNQKDLKGLRVEHNVDNFSEGQSVILTLKDSDILDDTESDVLVNVNMMDDEKAKKKIEDAKKTKTGYNPYDQEMVDDETGELKKKNLLDKYDEEIDGEAKKSFQIGSVNTLNRDKEKERIRDKLNKNLVSLELPEKKIASDYYTPGEVVAFKKTKKKKKIKRRILKADDLINMMNNAPTESFGSRNKTSGPKEIEDQDTGEIKDLSNVNICEEDKKEELSMAEKLRRKIKEKLNKKAKTDIGDILINETPMNNEEVYSSSGAELIGTFADDEKNSKNIILNETSEFCRNLGAWTSNYGSYEAKDTSSSSVLEEFEDSLKSSSTKNREERWREMDMSCGEDDADTDKEDDKQKPDVESVTILDEEPNLNVGVGSAIKMAVNKGYWESDVQTTSASNLKHLMSQNYFIEDKVRDDDRASRRQDRYGGGPTVAFQEKKDYAPNIKLEYIDDSGRKLNSKEAFRYLSHRFHGKGSGKLKTEKRMKKSAEESMMKNMSSTDTPLGTVEKMLRKQKETSTPYLVISGKNQHPDLRK